MPQGRFKDITGQKFGKLTVISRAENDSRGSSRWECFCDCGGRTVMTASNLTKGHTTSCGCIRYARLKESLTKHGQSKTNTFRTWIAMRQRCGDKKNKRYKDYGGRGIAVCDRWEESFINFSKDMGNQPDGHVIDRIDNNGNYEASNCRWVTQRQSQRNRRNNHILTINGVNKCIAEWSEIYNIDPVKVRQRIVNYGWDPIVALTV